MSPSSVDRAGAAVGGATLYRLIGFWLMWHAEGQEGLLRLGVAESTIYKNKATFRAWAGVDVEHYRVSGRRREALLALLLADGLDADWTRLGGGVGAPPPTVESEPTLFDRAAWTKP